MNAQTHIEQLKSDIGGILTRYHVPLEDRSYVLEKIEETVMALLDGERSSFQQAVQGVRSQIELERKNVQAEVGKIRDAATANMDIAKSKIDEAYQEGFAQGQMNTAAATPARPSTFQVLLGVTLAVVALIVAARSIFGGNR